MHERGHATPEIVNREWKCSVKLQIFYLLMLVTLYAECLWSCYICFCLHSLVILVIVEKEISSRRLMA